MEEGLSEDELALFDLLFREGVSQRERERLKQASKSLLASLQQALASMRDWTQNASTSGRSEGPHSGRPLALTAAAAVH